jgi:hypothetical protein
MAAARVATCWEQPMAAEVLATVSPADVIFGVVCPIVGGLIYSLISCRVIAKGIRFRYPGYRPYWELSLRIGRWLGPFIFIVGVYSAYKIFVSRA